MKRRCLDSSENSSHGVAGTGPCASHKLSHFVHAIDTDVAPILQRGTLRRRAFKQRARAPPTGGHKAGAPEPTSYCTVLSASEGCAHSKHNGGLVFQVIVTMQLVALLGASLPGSARPVAVLGSHKLLWVSYL